MSPRRLHRPADSQNLVKFRGKVNWHCLRDYSVVLQAAYDPLVAMRLMLVVSSSDKGRPLLVKAGRTSLTLRSNRRSWITNPRSAITSSPGRRYSRNPELAVMNLPLHLPPYAGEMNIIRPHGAIAMRNLIVLCP